MDIDNGLRRCFQDRPLDQRALHKMQAEIMNFVREHPIDFRQQLLLHKRRRWGLLLLGVLLVVGVFISALMEFWGMTLLGMVRQLVIAVTSYLSIPWITDQWLSFLAGLDGAADMLGQLKQRWQDYSTLVMVLLAMWIVQRGLSNNATHLK